MIHLYIARYLRVKVLVGNKYILIYIEPIGENIKITDKLFENVSEFGLFIVKSPIKHLTLPRCVFAEY
jgi:hypothetical protein